MRSTMHKVKQAFATVLLGATLFFSAAARDFTAAERNHWAFQPVRHPKPPATHLAWGQSPIDNFVLKKLEGQNITPSAPADNWSMNPI